MGTWGFSLGEAKQRICTLAEKQDTLGTPLPISLKWLECSYKELWDLEVNLSLSLDTGSVHLISLMWLE